MISWLNRSFVLYLIFILIFYKGMHYESMMDNAFSESINRIMPRFNYFHEFVDKEDHFNVQRLKESVYYYQKVIDNVPYFKGESYAMLGFCYERLGEYQKAIQAYEKSIQLSPSFFWTYYDLGIIYFRQRQYKEARDYFQKALHQPLAMAVQIPLSSKIFRDILYLGTGETKFDFKGSIDQGYHRAFVLLILSDQKLGDYSAMMQDSLRGLKGDLIADDVFLYYAGLAAYQLKIYDKALELLYPYTNKHPDRWQAFHYMALSLQGMGKKEAADFFMEISRQLKTKAPVIEEETNHWPVQFF